MIPDLLKLMGLSDAPIMAMPTARAGRAVKGFEQLYAATEDGRIISLRSRKELNPYLRKGYLTVNLKDRGRNSIRSVHRVVCEAFHGPAPAGQPEAAHLDGDPLNNHARNLTWASRAENENHKVAHGTGNRGESHSQARLTNSQANAIRDRLAQGERQKDLAAEFGVSKQLLSDLANGKSYASGLGHPATIAIANFNQGE